MFEAEAASWALGCDLLDCPFDAAEDDLPGRATLAAGYFMEAAV